MTRVLVSAVAPATQPENQAADGEKIDNQGQQIVYKNMELICINAGLHNS